VDDSASNILNFGVSAHAHSPLICLHTICECLCGCTSSSGAANFESVDIHNQRVFAQWPCLWLHVCRYEAEHHQVDDHRINMDIKPMVWHSASDVSLVATSGTQSPNDQILAAESRRRSRATAQSPRS
jgi:hypothetical protein